MKFTPFCPICGTTEFVEFNGRPQARCARCGAMERTRLLFGILNRQGFLAPGITIWHLAPEPGLAALLRRLAGRYVPSDVATSKYAAYLPEIQRVDLCDFDPDALGSFDLIIHMHVLEHIPCAVGPVLHKMGGMLNPGGRMYFSVPIRSAGATTEDLDPTLEGSERKARFGQHDHQRIFGKDDALELFRAALGPSVEEIDPLRHFSADEIRMMGIVVDVTVLSGHSILCYRRTSGPGRPAAASGSDAIVPSASP